MKVDGDYLFDAPPQQVWDVLFDPNVLASIMPGATRVTLVGNRYSGELNLHVGPVEGSFSTTVTVEDALRPQSCTLQLHGASANGAVSGTAHLVLEPEHLVRTRLRYDLDAEVVGSVAAIGDRLLEAALRALTKQVLDGLNWKLRAGLGSTDAVEVVDFAVRAPVPEPPPSAWSPTEPIEPTEPPAPSAVSEPLDLPIVDEPLSQHEVLDLPVAPPPPAPTLDWDAPPMPPPPAPTLDWDAPPMPPPAPTLDWDAPPVPPAPTVDWDAPPPPAPPSTLHRDPPPPVPAPVVPEPAPPPPPLQADNWDAPVIPVPLAVPPNPPISAPLPADLPQFDAPPPAPVMETTSAPVPAPAAVEPPAPTPVEAAAAPDPTNRTTMLPDDAPPAPEGASTVAEVVPPVVAAVAPPPPPPAAPPPARTRPTGESSPDGTMVKLGDDVFGGAPEKKSGGSSIMGVLLVLALGCGGVAAGAWAILSGTVKF